MKAYHAEATKLSLAPPQNALPTSTSFK
jgi:hypothetical protein